MIKHYFIVAMRQIGKSRFFSAINIIGFTISITAAFFIYFWVADELSYDTFHDDYSRIYRISETDSNGKPTGRAPLPLVGVLRNDYANVEDATYLFQSVFNRPAAYQDSRAEGVWCNVDTNFFRFFSFPVVEGDPVKLTDRYNSVVITDRIARQLFGNESAIGKQIREMSYLSYLPAEGDSHYTVVGVIKIPSNSHIKFDFVRFLDPGSFYDWSRGKYGPMTYMKLRTNETLKETDINRIENEIGAHGGGNDRRLMVQPLSDVRIQTDNIANMMTLFIGLSVIVLLMGILNFSVLSTARASLRYKETGIRAVCGANRIKLIIQFLSESIFHVVFALMIALCLVELFLPYFNSVFGKEIHFVLDKRLIIGIVICVLLLGILSGGYPAFYLSSLKPLITLKGGIRSGKKGYLYSLLSFIQFLLAIVLMICTVILIKQMYFIQNKDLGLRKDNILVINEHTPTFCWGFREKIKENPNVLAVSTGFPFSYAANDNIKWEIEGSSDSLRMKGLNVERGFIDVYGLEMISGKQDELFDFQDVINNRRMNDNMKTIVINETAWRQMGVENPVGLKTNRGRIVGVVKDFHVESLHKPIEPLFLYYQFEFSQGISIRISGENIQKTLRYLSDTYRETMGGFDFDYRFFDARLAERYKAEQQQSYMFGLFTVIAVVIAMMGVLGLVILTTTRRTKEIGIRKISGAETFKVIVLLSKDYIQWIALAFVLACPVAYWLTSVWLQQFAYRVEDSWWIYVLVGVFISLITLLTVGVQVYRVASQDPVKSLRYE